MRKSFLCTFAISLAAVLVAIQPSHAQGKPPVASSSSGAGAALSAPSTDEANMPAVIEKSPRTILRNNPQLGQRLQQLIPGEMTPQQAAVGYYDVGHFVAAVHASHDLGIPFADFKCTELGGKYCSPETKAKPMTLENVILSLKPGTNKKAAKTATKTAEHESKADLKGVNIY